MAALTQTMTGQDIRPAAATTPAATATPAPTGAPGDLTDEQKMVEAWMNDLNAKLAAIPNVDIAAKMQPLIEQAKSQKVPGKMPPLAAALAAFGAPQMAPEIAQHNQNVEAIQRQKDSQLLKLQEAIISGQIEQDMSEGKFQKALKQSQTLQMMKPQLDAAAREQAMQEYQMKEDLKQRGRMALVVARGAQARTTLETRAKQLAKGLSIDDRLLLAQVNHIARQQEIALNRAATYDPLSQSWTVNPTDMEAISQEGNSMLEEWINAHRTAPAPTGKAPAAPAAKPMSAQDRIRAAAGG